jgi:hypothetical protein
MLKFWMMNMSCILDSVCFQLSDHDVKCYCHLAWSCEAFHEMSNDLIVIRQNIMEILFHYRKWYKYLSQLSDWWIEHVCHCNRKKWEIYTKLPTYKKVVANQYSKNLEPRSHLPFVLYTSQAKSLSWLGRILLKLGKACVGLLSFEFLAGWNRQL